MSQITVSRNKKICALCRYWNGAIGSLSVRIVPGGMMFQLDTSEQKACFKPGKGIETNAMVTCPNFKPRYEN